MIIVVTGGRDYFDKQIIWGALDQLHIGHGVTFLKHGKATGVDSVCSAWASVRGVPQRAYVPDWNNIDVPGAVIRRNRRGLFNIAAGHWRNQQMIDLDERPEMGVVFPGGDGTADMYSRLRKAGVPRHVVAPSIQDQRLYTLSEQGIWYRPSPRKRK